MYTLELRSTVFEPSMLQCVSAASRMWQARHADVCVQGGGCCTAGTQGRVYRGTLDGQAVAVKIVDNVKTLRKIGAMPLEAALLRDLRHGCIVNLLKSGFAPGSSTAERQLWLVTELCDKGPLEVGCAPCCICKVPDVVGCKSTALRSGPGVAAALCAITQVCKNCRMQPTCVLCGPSRLQAYLEPHDCSRHCTWSSKVSALADVRAAR